MSIQITNIQRFCLNDGPGIRTTIFTKGCSIHCPWCSNPENIDFQPQYFFKEDNCKNKKCMYHDQCIPYKTRNALDTKVNTKYYCPFGALGIYGKEYTDLELIEEIKKDYSFINETGGVTFSGGEALLQIRELESVLLQLKKDNLHLAVETALFVTAEAVKISLKYMDFYYVDVKILDKKICMDVLGGDLNLYFENVNLIFKSGKTMVFRVPISNEYTLTENNQDLLITFFARYKNIKIELFEIHQLGKSKYQSMGKQLWENEDVDKNKLDLFYKTLKQMGHDVEIIEI